MPTVRRQLDPTLRDYVLTLGEYEEDAGITSKVWSRMATKKGSIVPLPSFGSLLHTIAGPVPGWEELAKRYTVQCLDDLVRAREVNGLKVTPSVQRTGSNALLCLEVVFRDRKGRRQRVPYTYRMTGS